MAPTRETLLRAARVSVAEQSRMRHYDRHYAIRSVQEQYPEVEDDEVICDVVTQAETEYAERYQEED